MTKLANHTSSETTKLLLIGDSGAGKTGALASLAKAGYNLRILDIDNGLDILANLLKEDKSGALERVEYETITDPMKNMAGKLLPAKATVWIRTSKLLDNWKTDSSDLGPISSWTNREVLVLDSLTMLSTAAMNFVLAMNGRLGQQPQQQDWYTAQGYVESLLQMLYDEGVKCNVIMIAHIAYIGEENGTMHGYPNTLGKALPPKVGRYFNSILMARRSGTGSQATRKLFTNPIGLVELKNTAPGRVKQEYGLETGLADYFRDVRSEAGPPTGPQAKGL